MRTSLTFLAILWLLLSPAQAADKSGNFSYLNSLRQTIDIPGKGKQVIWTVSPESLAARANNHDLGAPDNPADNISTSDIAWAALAYLKASDSTHAREALQTLVALQHADGGFSAYQSAVAPGLPPRFTDNDWMATARAIQALGAGRRVFTRGDLSAALSRALDLSLQRLQANHVPSNSYFAIDGQRLPAWLPANRADVAAAIALGYMDWQRAVSEIDVRDTIRSLCNGIADLQKGNPSDYPWEALLPRADQFPLWYGDGGLQVSALMQAYDLFAKTSYLSAAVREADDLYPRLLTSCGPPSQFSPCPRLYPQLPSSAAALSVNASELYRATNKERYAVMAGLFAAWFNQVYDPTSGRCADSMTLKGAAGCASPASTAQALIALLSVPSNRFTGLRPSDQGSGCLILPAAEGRPVGAALDLENMALPGGSHAVVRVGADNAFWLRFDVKLGGDYQVDMVYVKEPTTAPSLALRLDGDAVLQIALLGTDKGAVPQRLGAISPTHLEAGLHILGVRSSGIVLARTAVDAFVVQPLLEWRMWAANPSRTAIFCRSYSDRPQHLQIPANVSLPPRPRGITAWDALGNNATVTVNNRELTIPPRACALLEW